VGLDSVTGVVSGVPTTTGRYLFGVNVTLEGFGGSVSDGIEIKIGDPPSYTLSGWTTNIELHFSGPYRIDTLSGQLFVVASDGWGTGIMYAFLSSDGGLTWNKTGTDGAGARLGYATASDGSAVYLSGGNGASDVWKFDGAAWVRRTASAAFPGRSNHAMVKLGSALYIIGGEDAVGTKLGDVWKSTDGGATWSLVATPFSPRTRVCALAFNGKIVVIGGSATPPPGGIGGWLYEAWESPDGIGWTRHEAGAVDPMRGLDDTIGQQCVAMNGRVYFMGGNVVSTTDLSHWQFEPGHVSASFDTGGATAVGGRIYALRGNGTSERILDISTP
jgi:hypothetical protein